MKFGSYYTNFAQRNQFENVVRKISVILSRPQCVQMVRQGKPDQYHSWWCSDMCCWRAFCQQGFATMRPNEYAYSHRSCLLWFCGSAWMNFTHILEDSFACTLYHFSSARDANLEYMWKWITWFLKWWYSYNNTEKDCWHISWDIYYVLWAILLHIWEEEDFNSVWHSVIEESCLTILYKNTDHV